MNNKAELEDLADGADNSWSEVIELANGSVINSLSTDASGNIHFVWGEGYHIFYKMKCEMDHFPI